MTNTTQLKLRINLDELIKEKELAEGRTIKLSEVATNTGVTYQTLSGLRKEQPKGCNFSTIESLCQYFGKEVRDVLVAVS